ncbi:16S rRNA (cytosine(1402)-N(4))-methyltransferase RsmH [soil metagenome]
MSDAPHTSVMLPEVLDALAPQPGERMVDATFGAGGYTRALLDTGAQVLAFDRDPSARAFAEPLEAGSSGRFTLAPRVFSELEDGMADAGWEKADGIVFDLGVSSMQLDQAERGFSFMRDGPLDMRMGGEGRTAADFVNEADVTELARIFLTYGEERKARHIANVLVRRRGEAPFTRTLDLAEAVEKAVGGRRGAPTHPATRVFQALRIAVNEELAELEAGLHAAERALANQGRLVVVTFHSLEDRVVKSFLTERAGRTPSGSRHRPPNEPGPEPSFILPYKPMRAATDEESNRNPRARSANLRAAVRTPSPAWSEAA